MKKITIISLLFFFCIFAFFTRQVFLGNVPLPADDLVGLYYPFRDIYAATNPNGVVYKNSLITDPIRQQYVWKELSISLEKQLQLPLWNPYEFTGTPLLANFQSAVFYPLNIIFFLLPFLSAWSIQVLLQTVLLGLFTFFYLRFLKVHPLSQLLGAISICFCGFAIAWYEWNTIIQTFLWLPLILLAKENLLQKISKKWIIILLFAECSALFAGHLQTFFYLVCVASIYLLARIIQIVSKQKKEKMQYALRKCLPFVLIGGGVLLITSIQWLPTFQFINLSARSLDQQDWKGAGWFIPLQHLIQFIAPDFFGNPTTLNYWGIWNYGEFIGYIGIIPLFFALYGILQWKNWYVRFFTISFFVALLFALPDSISFIPFQLGIPFISTAQPTRLLSIIDFSLVILAAFGFDAFLREKQKRIFLPISFLLVCLGATWLYLFQLHGISADISVAKRNFYIPSLLIAVTVCLFIAAWFAKHQYKVYLGIVFILITIFDLFHFSDKFLPFVNPSYVYPSTSIMTYLQQHAGNYRVMTDDRRILPPNVSMHYGIQTIEGYDPLYLKNYGQLIAYDTGDKNYLTSLPFNREMTAEPISNRLASFLGVKYILSLNDTTSDPELKKVFSDGRTSIYENTNVDPRAFFVPTISQANSPEQAMVQVSALNTDLQKTAIVTSTTVLPHTYMLGNVSIASYTPNKIILHTKNDGEGFLLLTDSNYPTWHAFIDGKETEIYLTDYSYRGIVVPAGEHTIIFADSLF